MNFQVPQFIEIEDKIFGPLTFKQFIFTAGGAGAAYLVYAYLSKLIGFLAWGIAAPVFLFALGLAFYKINERPFIVTVEAAFRFFLKSKLYRWKKDLKGARMQKIVTETDAPQGSEIPKLTESRLSDLAWSLDVNERTGEGEL